MQGNISDRAWQAETLQRPFCIDNLHSMFLICFCHHDIDHADVWLNLAGLQIHKKLKLQLVKIPPSFDLSRASWYIHEDVYMYTQEICDAAERENRAISIKMQYKDRDISTLPYLCWSYSSGSHHILGFIQRGHGVDAGHGSFRNKVTQFLSFIWTPQFSWFPSGQSYLSSREKQDFC